MTLNSELTQIHRLAGNGLYAETLAEIARLENAYPDEAEIRAAKAILFMKQKDYATACASN